MGYRNRDMGIHHMTTRKNHTCYGMGLGIIVLDDPYPGFPGDVRNASAFPYPIQYEIAEAVDNYTLVWEEDKSPCREPIKRAAKKLEIMGCRAIAAECGYFAYFQKDVAGYVDVPVFMSSLLQVPFIQRVIGPAKAVGIVCAQKRFLTDTHLQLGNAFGLCLFRGRPPRLLRAYLTEGCAFLKVAHSVCCRSPR